MLKKIQSIIYKFNQSLLRMAENTLNLTSKRATDQAENNIPKKKTKKQIGSLGQSEGCRRKIAMVVAYNGKGYFGVQVNPGFQTIESDILPALSKIGAITQAEAECPAKMWFQRGSRTDKNVSAAGQIFSLKAVLVPDLIIKLNEELPPQIRAFGFVRTTNGFDSKNWCDSRTYMYMTPTFAFAPIEKFITDDYRTTSDILERIRAILKKFVGTHKFHNFTSGVKYEEACAKRYIINFECSDPYVRDGIEFITIRVKGQSFMMHQIRKMIGLTMAIVRGYCPESTIEASWGPEKVDVPKASGLGLVLEELHFLGYNKKFGCDGIHEPIDWSKHKEDMDKFKEEHIISSIVAQEKEERVTFNWLRTLQNHNFDQNRLYGPEHPWYFMHKKLKKMSPKGTNENEAASVVQHSQEPDLENQQTDTSSLVDHSEKSITLEPILCSERTFNVCSKMTDPSSSAFDCQTSQSLESTQNSERTIEIFSNDTENHFNNVHDKVKLESEETKNNRQSQITSN
ncbi:pseudouridylate synthase 1 homolog [Biomphalaria glabrata]|uniref:Pseudouridylate synthase 1 homolog n=1 Tax=Biomphalaria glabrata TaxID=6526 RepID=A0A9U8EIM8_BIOGL|nr:pseudouridylate synthase 1 homolog [Biomphalaria glabrata]XP_013089215.2 pseudouridylate synthase 1 homolog [Biomphalaria glabrata]XP_013089217.2 pseudouridylate synthase 1 homolog [Biomphalaria glabrata]XP_055872315.1 pseudouridylate synthase 1 homolog [Biomphalaria glabrata]XP_055872322.1 pseudouridylate synthase 1 homolog [Biomphalaria glabrata]XP_055872329.1 pseudouridylate synthase 1 homolog [Biomphalaria glabrata]